MAILEVTALLAPIKTWFSKVAESDSLGIELHQRGRVPVAHSAPLRAKVVEYLLCRRRILPGGGALPQSPELRQPCLSVRRRCGPRYGGESGHRLSLAGDDHFFTLLNQVDQPPQVGLRLFQRCC